MKAPVHTAESVSRLLDAVRRASHGHTMAELMVVYATVLAHQLATVELSDASGAVALHQIQRDFSAMLTKTYAHITAHDREADEA